MEKFLKTERKDETKTHTQPEGFDIYIYFL